ncbi:hypothetical protein LWI28_019143 [Acer negundo]|uniref:RNase H type-1 domain-containing protein n=1 Tax=Acer negundo TaxID=4023 RepID=A0AAD5P2A4_ACENE|nr:hypothetical protein LWI28_019143 [Acer negundo]
MRINYCLTRFSTSMGAVPFDDSHGNHLGTFTIFLARNQFVHQGTVRCDENTTVWACNFVEEFQRAGAKLILSDINQILIAVPVVKWDRLTKGVYKFNTDAAICVERNLVGVGVVIRDFEGCVVGSSTQRLAANFSPLVAEATALFRGIVFALEAGLTPLTAETDSKMVVDLIECGSSPRSDVGTIIFDIFQLIMTHCIPVRFALRFANMVAHSLAKLSLSSSEDLFYLESYPSFVERLVLAN